MMTNMMRFEGHPNAKAYKVYDEFGLAGLISYNTIVISIDEEGWLHVNGLYSRTTIKHIGWFMRELGFTYQLAKQLYEDNKEFNIWTGEVQNIDA